MKDIITKIPKINFTTSALTIFSPTGEVISINKIEHFNYHIEYLMILYKVNKEVRKILSGVDFAYYLKNPSEVVNDLIPQFALNGYGMQVNLTPNTMQPTNFVTREHLRKYANYIFKVKRARKTNGIFRYWKVQKRCEKF